ncbi:XRE family transcriptional regulator [Exiguobacterium sp. BMC-KP]|uniref:helix-turn-helix domain-containing protein n=1 Tax=Exiguobacterium sp. BMC-KP TaxID=1684312 RepID=UPI0006AA38D2|nr:helix-turn-helix transcriptional regulator [Exiguobacterium sp. BMC-KP]KOP31266.1 XRE family transcriptional regulator [Exiguobacterium sp. BMC-KP]
MKEVIQPIGQYGQRIRTLRERHQFDQHTLAELTETTPEMIQRIENSIAHPSFSMIERLARALHVPSDHLLRHIWPPEVIRQQNNTTLIDIPSS